MTALHSSNRLSLALAVLALAGVALSVMGSRPAPREIVVVAKGMTFYVADDTIPNPTITLLPNEKVRLRLINEDRGIDHDWIVRSLNLATQILPGDGSSQQILISAPPEPGRHDYACSVHDRMMKGTLEVVDPVSAAGRPGRELSR